MICHQGAGLSGNVQRGVSPHGLSCPATNNGPQPLRLMKAPRMGPQPSTHENSSHMTRSIGEFIAVASTDSRAWDASRLHDPLTWPAAPGSPAPAFDSPTPWLKVWTRGDVTIKYDASAGGLGMWLPTPAATYLHPAQVIDRWMRERSCQEQALRGRYAYLCWDSPARRFVALTDAFRTLPIYHATVDGHVIVASDLRLILATGLVPRRASHAAIYQYLNFSYVPAPISAVEGIAKLPAGFRLAGTPNGCGIERYWDATYPADLTGDENARVQQLRDVIVKTVERHRPGQDTPWGTFLSGGTDSSSISGVLARQDPAAQVSSFSIGFAEEGYDELGFSRVAVKYYGLSPNERVVDEAAATAVVPRLAQGFDEPFGNSSAIPTYYCADLAASTGRHVLVAGDGGDEIFGGNERYRKDQIFEKFHTSPMLVQAAARHLAGALGGLDTRWANRIKNFVRRGSLPNPDRFYTDDSFASDHFDELLSSGFRSTVRRDDALQAQRDIYAQAQADCTLHKLMYLDLKMTIADNDVVKVVRASRLAGVDVVFPYLDRDLVDFTGRLPGSDKVRGLNKRHLFKLAAATILPQEILTKKKQGFGLPVSVWLRRKGAFHDLVADVLLSRRAAERGYFETDFIKHLWQRHERGAWDHSAELYQLLMLELWHRHHLD